LQIIGLFFIIISIIAIVYASKTLMNRNNAITNIQVSNTNQISSISSSQASHLQSAANNKSLKNHGEFDIVIPFGDGAPGIRTTYFTPTTLHINAGDTVKWINKDSVSHTVTAMAFNSGLIWPTGSTEGPSTYSHTFTIPGVYVYFCQIHPYMGGIIYVDTQETQREISSNSPGGNNIMDVKIEIPQNAAYDTNYGPMFIPSGAHVPFGSQITFTNRDYVAHTATATDGTFDTSTLQPGHSKTFILDERQGTITYFCRIHPWMQAIITVDPPSHAFTQKISQ
jgi:plastocyanin